MNKKNYSMAIVQTLFDLMQMGYKVILESDDEPNELTPGMCTLVLDGVTHTHFIYNNEDQFFENLQRSISYLGENSETENVRSSEKT